MLQVVQDSVNRAPPKLILWSLGSHLLLWTFHEAPLAWTWAQLPVLASTKPGPYQPSYLSRPYQPSYLSRWLNRSRGGRRRVLMAVKGLSHAAVLGMLCWLHVEVLLSSWMLEGQGPGGQSLRALCTKVTSQPEVEYARQASMASLLLILSAMAWLVPQQIMWSHVSTWPFQALVNSKVPMPTTAFCCFQEQKMAILPGVFLIEGMLRNDSCAELPSTHLTTSGLAPPCVRRRTSRVMEGWPALSWACWMACSSCSEGFQDLSSPSGAISSPTGSLSISSITSSSCKVTGRKVQRFSKAGLISSTLHVKQVWERKGLWGLDTTRISSCIAKKPSKIVAA